MLVDGRVRREQNRKERASWEHERMIARYEKECKHLNTYFVDPETLKNYKHGQELNPIKGEAI